MSKIEPARVWALNYRLLTSVIHAATPDVAALGLEVKELFILAEVEEHPYPAELAGALSMPKPTITVYVKRLEAAGLLRREIDRADLRRHRLALTPAGRKAAAQGRTLLSSAFSDRLGRLSAAEQATLLALLEKMA